MLVAQEANDADRGILENRTHDMADPSQLEAMSMDSVKQLYVKLKQEQRRAEVYHQNLSKKMQRLKHDLDVRTEEVESLQRTLQLEKRKHEDQHLNLQREHEFKAKGQEGRIRDCLAEVLYLKPPNASPSEYELETVLVSFVRAGSCRYNLTFRIDDHTTVRELLAAVCRYWGVQEDDYVLRTLASNKCQDEILVKECFKQGEIAQLKLEEKCSMSTDRPTDDEMKAIQPRQKRNKKQKERIARYDEAAVSNVQHQHDNHAMELRKMGGVYFLPKKRNMKPSEHVAKIKLRDVIIYSILIILTITSYYVRRPSGQDYWLTQGFTERIAAGLDVDESGTSEPIPGLHNVSSHDDLWLWLERALPAIIGLRLSPSTTSVGRLETYNLLLGYVAIRIQNVLADSDKFCTSNIGLVRLLKDDGAICYAPTVYFDNSQRVDLPLETYWEKKLDEQKAGSASSRLRGPSKPWKWSSAEQNEKDHNIPKISGILQGYDASGYLAEYRIGNPDVGTGYQEDMAEMKRTNWISHHTRLVVVSWSSYNFDYDRWIASDIAFELPPSGAIKASLDIEPFLPRIMETRSELSVTYSDYVRVIIAIYIAIFVGINERQHKIKNHQAGCWYHASANGICDLGIVVCVFCTVLWRAMKLASGTNEEHVNRMLDSENQNGFWSFRAEATAYASIFCVEGLLMVFLMHRLLSFARLSRTVYLLWHTLGNSLRLVVFFALLFLPTVAGFTLIVHAIYGPYLEEYALISTTLMQVYKLLKSDLDVTPIVKLDTVWAMIVLIVFYVTIYFFLMNVFLAIVVDAYYGVVLISGTPGESWTSRKRARWVLPGIILSCFQTMAPPTASESG